MDNLILSFTVIMPIFIMMVLGYVLKEAKIFDIETIRKINKSIFKIFLPALIFYNVYTSEIAEVFNLQLIIYSIISIVIVTVLAFAAIVFLEKDNSKRGVLIQGVFRSNFAIFGVPLSISLYGDSIIGTASVMIAIIVPVFNILAVVVLETFRSGTINFKNIMKGIITNPLIIASVLGLLALFLDVSFPVFINNTIRDISKVSTPLALIALGGSIDFKKVKCNIKQLIIGITGKLIVTPALILTGGILLGFRGPELAILISLSASPVAVSSFTMAQQMGGDTDLAAQLQMFGTTICIFTVFLWIFALKQLGVM